MIRLGRAIWRQSRDISVWNYPSHMVFEINTNKGIVQVCQNKTTDKIDWVYSGKYQELPEMIPSPSAKVDPLKLGEPPLR